ncbi:MAG: hypothetical protein IJV30_04935 [Oscillospiraceae bacterium]|nr:hypothetical protein [Oscillospiraceae bacterium]
MKRLLSVLTILVLLLSLALPAWADTALTSSAETQNLQKAYYNSDYAYLEDPDSVFSSLTLEEAIYLFRQEGNYLLLLGGSWCGNTTPVIGYIDQVAKEYGIDTIYNLDFRLDGTNRASHIRETNGASSGDAVLPGSLYNYLYGELVTNYLVNLNDFVEYQVDTESALTYTDADGKEVTVPKVQVPFLFLYNRDNTDADGNPAPIVAGLELMKVRDDFVTDNVENTEAVDEYKAILRESVFDAASETELDSFSGADYIRLAYNEKAEQEIFTPDEQINIQPITYKQLTWLLEQDGSYLILLGGSWCGNTRAVIKLINDYAVRNHVTVYNFDTKLDGGYARKFWGYEKDLHIRDNSSEFVGLYVDLVSEYFPNIETEYAIDSENNIFTVNAEGETVTVNKLQVPYFLAYTRGLEDDIGHFVPITAYHEQMLTLDADAEDYVYSEENYAAYTAGIYAVIQSYADQLGIEAFDLTD